LDQLHHDGHGGGDDRRDGQRGDQQYGVQHGVNLFFRVLPLSTNQ